MYFVYSSFTFIPAFAVSASIAYVVFSDGCGTPTDSIDVVDIGEELGFLVEYIVPFVCNFARCTIASSTKSKSSVDNTSPCLSRSIF
jgi:hypothetical protein